MEAATAYAGNGTVPMTARDKIAHDLEAEIARIDEEREELSARLATLTAESKDFKQALQRLRNEPLRQPNKSSRPRAARSSSIGDERLDQIRQAILQFARDHDEFRQVDLRTITGQPSGAMATAFEMLRQEGLIRFARKDGLSKVFRLTSEGIRQRDEGVA